MKYIITFLLIGCFFSPKSWAQDPEFSQFYAAPLHLNAAMIGFGEAPRFVANFRDQQVSFGNAFITTALSYDQHFYKYNSSIGAMLLVDIAGQVLYNYQFAAMYAYQLQLNNNLYLKVGLQAGVVNQSISTAELIYRDMLDPFSGQATQTTAETPLEQNSITKFDAGAGICLYNDGFYMGTSVKHITAPNVSFSDNQDQSNILHRRYSIHAGKTFYLGKNRIGGEPFYIVPNILGIQQADFSQLNVGAYMGKELFYGGLWFRHTFHNPDALIVLLGMKINMFKIGYSYDFTVSGIKTNAGAHELSLTLDLGKDPYYKKKERLRNSANCPQMFK
ncbi:MAG: PorP/SprF family type IX secretion system membrane protein [Chitinophagales bacterium]|nr:PorP/SprF family type IX secretion system membrane protein [Bacteroidota bacterium]